MHQLLLEASEQFAKAGRVRYLAVTQMLSTLHQNGPGVLSVFEMLTFTYHCPLRTNSSERKQLILVAECWRVSDAEVVDAGVDKPRSPLALLEEDIGDLYHKDFAIISIMESANLQKARLVVAVGSMAGSPLSLRRLGTVDPSTRWSTDGSTLGPFENMMGDLIG